MVESDGEVTERQRDKRILAIGDTGDRHTASRSRLSAAWWDSTGSAMLRADGADALGQAEECYYMYMYMCTSETSSVCREML